MTAIRQIPLDQVFGNPDQPRKVFEPNALADLAESIRLNGLLQPIKVTPRGGRFMVICGERRFRAHQLLGAATVPAIVSDEMSDLDVMVEAIVENGQRVDVHPLEEAVAYQACLDQGMPIETLAARLGLQQPWRVTERTCLLRLREEYQQLFRKGQIGASQAFEMAQLEGHAQDLLFRAIKGGECPTYNALRAKRMVIEQEMAQASLFDEPDAKPSDLDRSLARGLEARFSKLAAALRASTVDNEVVAVKKVDPNRADTLADLLSAMQGDLKRIELALRVSAMECVA